MFFGKTSSADWESAEPVSKGWSSDRKYRIRTRSGQELLLRLSDASQYDSKKKEYEIMRKYEKTGICMSMPLEFGVCNDGADVYILLTWIEGRDLESVLPTLPEQEQYALGREAGRILKKIHSIELDPSDVPTRTKRERKLMQLEQYMESDVRIGGDETAIAYVKDNIGKIWLETPVYQHGDFHPGNLIYRKNGSIGVIDFNRWEVGDPYEEFYKLESFGIEQSIAYCVGQIDAYFDGEIPLSFWQALAVYVAQASLFSIKWAEKFGPDDVEGMVRRCRQAFADYDDFRRFIPKWYTDKYRRLMQ